jgi:hypothetical protein
LGKTREQIVKSKWVRRKWFQEIPVRYPEGKKKKHATLKQIFILSRDALMERKGRSALTILMVLVGGALMVTINGMSEESNSAYHAYKKGTLIQGMWVGCIILLHVAPLMAQ